MNPPKRFSSICQQLKGHTTATGLRINSHPPKVMAPENPAVKLIKCKADERETKNVSFDLISGFSAKLNSEPCCSVVKVLFHDEHVIILDGANKKLKVFSLKGTFLSYQKLFNIPKHGCISPAGNIFVIMESHLSLSWFQKSGSRTQFHRHVHTKHPYSLVHPITEGKLVCCMDKQPGYLDIINFTGEVLYSVGLYEKSMIIMGHSHLSVSTDGNSFALNGYTVDGSDIFLCMSSNGDVSHKLVDKKMQIVPCGVHAVLNSFYVVCKEISSLLHISMTNEFEPYYIPLSPCDYCLRFDDIFFLDNQTFLISHHFSELISIYRKGKSS